MQIAEKRQLENINILYTAVYKLKQKIQDLVIKFETQGDQCDWPRYLSTLALCASELGEIRKILESDRFSNEHTLVLTPIVLNPEHDANLAKITEERLSLFNHDTVPQYLRTKLDPKVESECSSQATRAASIPSDQVNKLINLSNRAIDCSLKEINLLKQDLDADFSDRQNKIASNPDDLVTLMNFISRKKGLNTSNL
ncbi:Mediator of RNA polymerase II transcription subunit 8 [Schistosoma japonicum]|uniref:Mediator of RNA polymerase II transcription subunit 8 n=1 Tax=Schistosoma japonicum TaxID=6182 RepID=A0A4Z2CNG0_SCHJA|nr:Mediator of RNA polymerase II transcription subunit 8 [Schistosoma japonicum]KAH8859333.1 Mediator of RNA polymerase II transcription subunit 8 [Schistosoma japonicum]TNN05764.1 Mediator of RNA polymerase II transcription subunit 8 [Schistosoma japonicum]TNN05765.1 Mediator of RNA polymerase II transcription subunit 8 [Schistosoma japonicum]